MAKTILIADDSPTIRERLSVLLNSIDGYQVCAVAVNGQQATEFALEHRPDLIVLDLSMPAKDGIETAKERKKLMPTVPIVLFTQYADLARHFLTSTKLIDHVGSKNEPMKLVAVVKSLAPL